MEQLILAEVRRRGSADIIELADAVAVKTRGPLRMIDRVVRTMIQTHALLQDANFKVYENCLQSEPRGRAAR